MPVVLNDKGLRDSISRMQAALGNNQAVMSAIGKALTEYVQQTITMGGRNSPFAPLSEWTQRRTGRTQPLITTVDYFGYTASSTTVSIFFKSPGSWNITQHHEGFVSRAVRNKLMAVPQSGSFVFFKSRRESRIPAREVWPEQDEARAVVMGMIQDYLDRMARDNWHD